MRNYVLAGLSLLLIAVGMTVDYRMNIHVEEGPTMPALTGASAAAMKLTPEQERLSEFFAKHGSPAPREMAVAVSATKRPALMAAIAVRESNGTPWAVGDNGEAKGSFQVWDRYHGKVSSDPVEQALQAERILEDLVASEPRGRLLHALSAYNTGSYHKRVGHRYARQVINLKRRAVWQLRETVGADSSRI